jgi:acid phosphatase
VSVLADAPVAVAVAADHSPARVQQLRAYHDSGAYGRDLRAVTRKARAALLDGLAAEADGADAGAKPAIVLDVDETSLSNYRKLSASDFGNTAVPAALAARPDPAIVSTRGLYRTARARGVAVFFVTGRAPARRTQTLANLRSAGYRDGWTDASFRPRAQTTVAFKSATRAAIERRGYTILVNLGDQRSDLQGGHARRAFKLPNPFYTIR